MKTHSAKTFLLVAVLLAVTVCAGNIPARHRRLRPSTRSPATMATENIPTPETCHSIAMVHCTAPPGQVGAVGTTESCTNWYRPR
jgi:hypothetical protein